MSYKGIVEGGVIVLAADTKLPNGTEVEVRPVRKPARNTARSRQALLARIDAIAAKMPPMPADWAAEHDHYIHGTPKRSARR